MDFSAVFSFTKLDGSATKVRTAVIEGKEWFVASDVCKALNMGGSAARWTASLPAPEKVTVRSSDNRFRHLWYGYTHQNKPPRLSLISEAGLYVLLIRSDKPDARPFQDWVTKVVLLPFLGEP
ncbi:BRO-N domain-containing protein [Gluconobacter oxydans]|uniref:BRO-N domain-containing protein n=1 Tax=Gluconobacter oxydans TaxID=442 RepID=UPI0022A9FA8B|nr:Bro-N domain-containing protein [Gluconobacter oxydans]